jgi:large-conductance mechanosensitive channel
MSFLSYGSLTVKGKVKAGYSPLREADAEADTAASRHTFSVVPVVIAFVITAAIIYVVVMMKKSSKDPGHSPFQPSKHHNPGEA